jgi:hypothetical protein
MKPFAVFAPTHFEHALLGLYGSYWHNQHASWA